MPLRRCTGMHGNVTLIEHAPMLELYRDVLCVPWGTPDASAGVFDAGRKLVTAAAYFRASPHPVPMESYYTTLVAERHDAAPCDATYVFLGHLTGHYGHFLLASLARLWALDLVAPPNLKLVVLNRDGLDQMFARPFIRDILQALDVRAADIVSFAGPTRIGRLVVPSPAIEETNFVHRIFGAMGRRIGDRILAAAPHLHTPHLHTPHLHTSDTPVFLSKIGLSAGVLRVVNEDALCARLQAAGVEIVLPERLDLAAQIQLFRSRAVVAGIAGSALHTALFAPGSTMLSLHHEPIQLANQLLLDRASGGATLGLFPDGEIERAADTPSFQNTVRLTDPVGTAEQFLHALDSLTASRTGRRSASAVAIPMRPHAAGRQARPEALPLDSAKG